MASVCLPSAVLSPPLPTDALLQSGYLTTVVQPYVEQNALASVGNLGGQVQVPQPAACLAQQVSSASSQQTAIEVNGLSASLWVFVCVSETEVQGTDSESISVFS